MGWGDLLSFGRLPVAALHKTWVAFFLTFFVWFNMAPLATTIIKTSGLTAEHLKLLAVCNVALTAPSRVVTGMLTDRFGPRRTFTAIMVAMSLPCFAFALSNSYTQMLASRVILSMVGTGFVVGIHMTSLWFKPRDIGFAQGAAGFGNWGLDRRHLMPMIALNALAHGDTRRQRVAWDAPLRIVLPGRHHRRAVRARGACQEAAARGLHVARHDSRHSPDHTHHRSLAVIVEDQGHGLHERRPPPSPTS
jgi:NNP family nitrate/nitrite transporter-like MFS transporter